MSSLLIKDLKQSNQILRDIVNEKKKLVDELRKEKTELELVVTRLQSQVKEQDEMIDEMNLDLLKVRGEE